MSDKNQINKEVKRKLLASHSSDTKKVDDMFKNSPNSEGEMGSEGCFIRFGNKEDDYEGDGTEWIYVNMNYLRRSICKWKFY